ncbi:MAG TPA: arsenate reductase (glutaredoxin) [Gammaproteobacteria bacterium]|nr:arsenate reductase (glutaredoxin) [Gammaproteobacteria bacterium]
MVTIFHNPRCSKSRAALELLRAHGIEPRIVPYLDTPPDVDTLRELLRLLDMAPRGLLRRNEEIYRRLGLDDPALTDEMLLAAMAEHPVLIERPIVIANGKARIGRPPEAVLDIL